MFNKNKKKTDSKIRFQNSRFKKQLQSAREFKRPKRNMPKTDWDIFLAKVGLGSWLSRILTALVFLFLIYLVFIPNLFFVKKAVVNDSDPAGLVNAQNLVASYLGKNLPWPQKNLLLLSKGKLRDFLMQNDKQILNVSGISKKFPSTLIVNITPRVDEFEVLTASSTAFSVSNDGLVTGELFPNASGTLPTLSYLIKLTEVGNLNVGQTAFGQTEINFIQEVANQLPEAVKMPLAYYEISDLTSPYLSIYMQTGLQIKLDSGADLTETLSRLNLLLSQLAPGDLKNLYYVDMRFAGRGYTCYKNTPCATNAAIPNIQSTSTLDNLGN